jgi:RNA polymerase sigma-70 factor (ECF subfamily)
MEGESTQVPRITIESSHRDTTVYGFGEYGEHMVRRGAAWSRFKRSPPRENRQNPARHYTDAPDPELVSWSASGDRRAFDEIVTRHGPLALRVATRLIPDPSAAEDLAQEAMVRAWTHANRFDPRRAQFTTWLYRIVANLCIDHRRRRQLEAMPEHFDPIDPAAGAAEEMEVDERDLAVAKALEGLPARQRAAMTLVYDEGLSGAEAARILGLSAKAVERLLARARACVREHLQSKNVCKGARDVDA